MNDSQSIMDVIGDENEKLQITFLFFAKELFSEPL